MIIAGRDKNSGARFSTVVDIGYGLPGFNIGDNTINHFANILIGITHRPPRDVIIIFRHHKTSFDIKWKSIKNI